MKHIIYFLLIAQLIAINTKAQQPGTLDPSFANEGILISNNLEGVCNVVAVQDDGKIIGAGTGGYDDLFGFLLTRYNEDGTVDESFGDKGRVITNFNNTGSEAFSLMLLSDNKILASGNCDNTINIGLARYMPDGSPDSSFGENGKVIFDLGVKEHYGYMALQSDGKIVVTGDYVEGEIYGSKTFIARFLPDGQLDESFGTNGSVVTAFSSLSRVANIVIQNDDKIVIAETRDFITGHMYGQVSRYMPDGAVDMSFGDNGIAKAYYSKVETSADAIALQKDGKIIMSGFGLGADEGFGLVRFETNGTIEKTFGVSGLVITQFDSSGSEAKTLQIQDDGKIVAAGSRYDGIATYFQFALARYNTDGSLDSSFGVNGLQHTEAYPFYIAVASALQKDGKIVLTGNGGYPYNFVFARYFGGDGVLPVKYTSISAKQNKNTVVLTWQTTGENSNNFFTVEHAANEYDFTQIAKVNVQSNNNLAQQYSYIDKAPLQGNNFYRIKQTDASGNYSYSKTVAVNFAGKDYIQLYPNPAKDLLTVKGLHNNEVNKLFLYDLQGKLLQQFTTQNEVYSFSVSNIAAGTYLLQVQNSNGVSSHRFVKK